MVTASDIYYPNEPIYQNVLYLCSWQIYILDIFQQLLNANDDFLNIVFLHYNKPNTGINAILAYISIIHKNYAYILNVYKPTILSQLINFNLNKFMNSDILVLHLMDKEYINPQILKDLNIGVQVQIHKNKFKFKQFTKILILINECNK